jgi:hypothetical protein
MKLKAFQREDLARGALHDGLILGQDAGLGKGLAAYIWPLLKVGLLRAAGKAVRPVCPAEPILLIASGDLHAQIISEGIKHFGTSPKLLDSQETFLRLSSVSPNGRRVLPPGYYLTTYTQLSRNGVTPFPDLDKLNPSRMLKVLNLSTGIPQGTKARPDPSVFRRNSTGCGGSALRMFSSFCLAV